MAHPKLATVFNRSLLAASTAALIAGPLAAAGSAQSLETVTDTTSKVVDLTCDEAKKTEDLELIAEFCEESELSGPLAKATEEARTQLEQEAAKTTATVEKSTGVKVPTDPTGGGGDDDGDSGGGGGGGESTPDSSPTGSVLPPASGGSDETKSDRKAPAGSRQVRNQGEQPRGISAGGQGGAGASGSYGGPVYSGMQTNSSLTLQPFAAPLVSVPPVYELPQVAQELFGIGDEAATTGDPMVAMADGTTATSAFSNNGMGATPDASGWLAATATGLIMLLGAAHALNGARTPKRKRA